MGGTLCAEHMAGAYKRWRAGGPPTQALEFAQTTEWCILLTSFPTLWSLEMLRVAAISAMYSGATWVKGSSECNLAREEGRFLWDRKAMPYPPPEQFNIVLNWLTDKCSKLIGKVATYRFSCADRTRVTDTGN